LGRGRAWREGEWELRHRRTEEVIDPAGSATRADEDDLDGAATAAPNLPVAQRLTAR
jgi:hypothetical protein